MNDDINVALAIRNNVMLYMKTAGKPVTTADLLENAKLPTVRSDADLSTRVNRALMDMIRAGQVIRMPIEGAPRFGAARYTYRLPGKFDPAPQELRSYKPRREAKKSAPAEKPLSDLFPRMSDLPKTSGTPTGLTFTPAAAPQPVVKVSPPVDGPQGKRTVVIELAGMTITVTTH